MTSDPVEQDGAGGGTGTGLDEAVASAVTEGLRVVEELTEKVTGALGACVERADRARTEHGDRAGKEALEAFADFLHEATADATGRFARQRSRLETFNVVLFGRTGAGKSSLIEALSSGSGAPISQGESDWTTEVRDVRWRACRLVDTPGIAGWGRTVAREALEARAEAAVADADVVLLCFDTQSQQDGEFTKVAEWVSRYGKPVVAVLNCRNPRWRFPTRVGHEATRRHLSRSVHEHMGNIQDELDRVGLPSVPIVAIHTQRAAFARTSDPYEGPQAEIRTKLLGEVGPDRLLAWSNLPALELLISEALAKHAEPLRLGMLHEQARGVLTLTVEGARTDHGAVASIAAEQIERGIADVLGIVGYPKEGDLPKRLRTLEKLRGGGFEGSGSSELLRHAKHLLAAGLRRPRAAALRKADRLIEGSFGEGVELSPERFESEVLTPALTEAESLARKVGADLQQYLSQRLALVADDLRADLTAAITAYSGAKGAAGRSGRRLGLLLESGSGILSMGSGTAMLAAFANAWNPAGWVIGAVTVASAIVGLAMSVVGGWLRRRGAHQRETARSAARSAGRRSVHDTFDKVERLVAEEFHRILSKAAHDRLADEIDRSIALRRVSKTVGAAVKDLERTVAALPKIASAGNLLSDVATDLERQLFPGEATADRLLWLGEDWCTDPEGLEETESPIPPSTARGEHDRAERLTDRIRVLTGQVALRPQPGAGSEWLVKTLAVLAADDDALTALVPARALLDGAAPRIVVAGDYSAGKSSFIKRLLVDSGAPVPDELDVAAQPRTAAAVAFSWQGRDLVDTPGFQSSHALHAASAHEAVVGASVVILLFNPNLVVGDRKDLLSVLVGDPAGGRIGKLPRTIFVINRSDELGVDPHDDPAAYESLCNRKELELAQAVGSLLQSSSGEGAGDVTTDQILCVASDPYGMVGDRRDVKSSDYDRHRDWDGMSAFHEAFGEVAADIDGNGQDVRLLESGAVILGDLLAARRDLLRKTESEVAQLQRLLLDINACLLGGRALQASARDRLATRFVWFVANLFDEIAETKDRDAKAAKVKRLENWATDKEAQQIFREWATRVEREQEEWRAATAERLERRIASAAFVTAFSGGDEDLDVDHLAPKRVGVGDRALDVGKESAKFAKGATREAVTKIAHAFGHKFEPWGATKLTGKVNAAGGALGLAFGAVELYSVWRSTQKEGEAEREAQQRRAESLQQVRKEAEVFFDGAAGTEGAGAVIAEALADVEAMRDETSGRLDAALTEARALAEAVEQCEERIRDALERLQTGART